MITIWVVFALLTAAAVFAVLWPLSRPAKSQDLREIDVAFYQAQTAEIERDAARGLIGAEDAGHAKTEAARRLVAAAARDGRHSGDALPVKSSPWGPRIVSIAAVIFIPLLALALYARIGQPELPDMPLDARLEKPAATMDLATAVAKIERHLAEKPDDGHGYEVLAPAYMRMGRPDDAVRAYGKAIELLGPTAERYAGLGEAQVYAGSGVVTAEAKHTFEQALALDPHAPRGLFYLGLAAQQDGDKDKALELWRKLAAASPPNAPWMTTVRSRIASLSGAAAPDETPAGPAGEGQAKMAAAIQAMPDDQRQAMIHRMVDGLAERLKSNGADLDGWLRLVRAYQVLNEPAKAKDALADARRNFAADAAANKQIDALAHELGLEG